MFRNVTLNFLTEIAGLNVSNYDAIFISLFNETMSKLEEVRIAIFSLQIIII